MVELESTIAMENGKSDCMIYLSTMLIFHSFLQLPGGMFGMICIPSYSMSIATKYDNLSSSERLGNYMTIVKGFQWKSDDFSQKMTDSGENLGIAKSSKQYNVMFRSKIETYCQL